MRENYRERCGEMGMIGMLGSSIDFIEATWLPSMPNINSTNNLNVILHTNTSVKSRISRLQGMNEEWDWPLASVV